MTKEQKDIVNQLYFNAIDSKEKKVIDGKVYIPLKVVTSSWGQLMKKFRKMGIR